MSQLVWSADLETGIEIIDEQHKRIVHYINELYDVREGKNSSTVANVINELVDYTVSHFAFEESLMEQAGYPFVGPHKKVHELFVERVSHFVERHKQGEDITEELLKMLNTWLVNHIKSEDGDYIEVVQANIGRIKKEGSWLTRTLKGIFR